MSEQNQTPKEPNLGPSDSFIKEAIYLVDASSYIFRAYYAIRSGLKSPSGTPTHATYGFIQMLLSLFEIYQPHKVVFVWDTPAKGYRHELFPQYKANRSAPPEDLGIQIDNTKKVIDTLGIFQTELAGFEADDIIATLVRKNPNKNFVIVTGDKDLLQLVGPNVWCLDTMKNKWSNTTEAIEKFGVKPDQIKFVQALSGDSVDNIPGAPGVGPKTATELVSFFNNLDSVIHEAQELWRNPEKTKSLEKGNPLKGKRIEAIANNADLIRISLKLVTLNTEVPVNVIQLLEEAHPHGYNQDRLSELFGDLGFKKVLDKTKAVFGSTEITESSSDQAPSEMVTRQELSPFKTTRVQTVEEFKSLLSEARNSKHICLDTETSSIQVVHSPVLVGLSLALSEDCGFYIPLRHVDSDGNLVVGNLDINEVRSLWNAFIQNASVTIVLQNAKFDLHVLESEQFLLPKDSQLQDTMIASYCYDPTESHGMDSLSQKYLGGYQPQPFKEVLGANKNFSQVGLESATFYAAEDAVITLKLWNYFKDNLGPQESLYRLIDRPLMPVLTRMESKGALVDLERLQKLSEEYHIELKNIESQAKTVLQDSGVQVGPDFNLLSTKQMADILYEQLKLPIKKKGKTGPSTDVGALEELESLHPFPKILLEYREVSKLLSTYVDSFPTLVNSKTGRLHTDYSQTLTVTGRLSSSRPNLQNIPIRTDRGKKIREAFVAPAGKILFGADYSQIELRLLAIMSQDQVLIQAFKEGADIHRRTAALILGKSENLVSDEERRMAKTINFGIIYGQTSFGLSKQLGISKTQAQVFIDNYFKTYPGISEFSKKAVQIARDTKTVRTLAGRVRPLPEIDSKNVPLRLFAERSALNSPLQGTAADLIKLAMVKLDHEIQTRFKETALILQVHDELLFETTQNELAELKNLVHATMEDKSIFKDFGVEDFPIVLKVDTGEGRHWGEI